MKDLFKFLSIAFGAAVVLIGGALLILNYLFTGNSENYNKQDLIKNYNEKYQEISEVKRYGNSILPTNKNIEIEFADDDNLEIFHLISNGGYDSNWNIKVDSKKTDSLLKAIGWTRNNLLLLKSKLDNANCISFSGGNPSRIGFKRSGFGIYFYKVFNTPLNDSTKAKYNDGCTYCFYKNNIVLEYGGGAIGPQCFEDFKHSSK